MHKLLFIVHVLIVPSIRRWRIDFKIRELVVGELTRWRNNRLPLWMISSGLGYGVANSTSSETGRYRQPTL